MTFTQEDSEMHETDTHWDSSHQPMDPSTPPEFLKMASHGPSYIVHVYRCRTLCFFFSLLRQKPIQSYWWGSKNGAIVWNSRRKWPPTSVRKTTQCGLRCGESPSVVKKMVALCIIRGCHHTSRLSILGQLMWGGDALFLCGRQSVGVH